MFAVAVSTESHEQQWTLNNEKFMKAIDCPELLKLLGQFTSKTRICVRGVDVSSRDTLQTLT